MEFLGAYLVQDTRVLRYCWYMFITVINVIVTFYSFVIIYYMLFSDITGHNF